MASNDKLLNLQDLTKVFITGGGFAKSKLVAVNKASFNIRSDTPEVFTLAGESGSGKTTLARIVLGLISPTSGTMRYKGRDLKQLSKKEKRRWFFKEVQPIFQNPFESFSPLKKVDTYLFTTASHYKWVEDGKSVHEIVEDNLQTVGLSLEEVEGRFPNELSGGQLQRMSVARALITNPSLLIADEPVSMVDASLRMSIVNLFKELKEEYGVSVLYITHDLATAYYVSDRIAIMLRGYIVEMGPVEKVLNEPLHPYTRLLRRSVPQPDPDQTWDEEAQLSTLESEEYALAGCKFAGRCPEGEEICKDQEPRNVEEDERIVKCHLYDSEIDM